MVGRSHDVAPELLRFAHRDGVARALGRSYDEEALLRARIESARARLVRSATRAPPWPLSVLVPWLANEARRRFAFLRGTVARPPPLRDAARAVIERATDGPHAESTELLLGSALDGLLADWLARGDDAVLLTSSVDVGLALRPSRRRSARRTRVAAVRA